MTTTDRLDGITQEEHSQDGSTAAGDLRSETPAAPQLDDVMRHLRNARRRVAEVEARCAEQKASLRAEVEADCRAADERAAAMTAADRRRIDELEALAAGMLSAEMARNPKTLHLDSVWGRISSRATQPTICWPEADELLIAWAKEQERGFVTEKTVTTLDKKAIKNACRVEGCRLVLKSGGLVPYVDVAHNGRSVAVETLP